MDTYTDLIEERSFDLDSDFADDYDSPYDYGEFTDEILDTGYVFTEGTVFDDR
jgi:hypothetical protein